MRSCTREWEEQAVGVTDRNQLEYNFTSIHFGVREEKDTFIQSQLRH